MSGKRKWLTLEEKINVLREFEKTKCSQRQLAERFGVGKTQIFNILKDKEDIYKAWHENGTNQHVKKRMKTESCHLDSIMFEWFCAARDNNVPISGRLLQEKAAEVSTVLGLKDFKASNGWLQKFKIRHNIHCKAICAEPVDVPLQTADEWKEEIKKICEGYEERDIFSCGETGLFYRAVPDKSLFIKKEKCFGGEVAKECLTVLLCANMKGEFENPLIIGKSGRPRCFKGVQLENLKMNYKANRNSWITSEIMTEWLDEFDRKMKIEKRKVLLFLDNAMVFPDVQLGNIKLIFLPSNTSALCQPLNMGVIKCFRCNYKKNILCHILANTELVSSARELAKKVTILDAITWIISAVRSVNRETVRKCFFEAGFLLQDEIIEQSSSMENQQLELENLLMNFTDEINLEEYLSLDDNICTYGMPTDINEIIAANTLDEETKQTDESDSDDESENTTYDEYSYNTALKVVESLEHFSKKENNTILFKLFSDAKIEIEKQCVLKKHPQWGS